MTIVFLGFWIVSNFNEDIDTIMVGILVSMMLFSYLVIVNDFKDGQNICRMKELTDSKSKGRCFNGVGVWGVVNPVEMEAKGVDPSYICMLGRFYGKTMINESANLVQNMVLLYSTVYFITYSHF